MWIMQDSLPNGKSFFRGIRVTDSVRAMVVRFMISILVRQGRNSCMQAASVLEDESRHRAQPARFLRRVRWRSMDLLGQVVGKLLQCVNLSGRFFLIVDSTLVGHQGQTMENTYSTGHRPRHPKKNRRYKKYKYAPKSCHCFVFGLLLTPDGVRVPFCKPLYTRDYAKRTKQKHRTQAQLAADIVREVPVPEGASVVVLGDTAFDAAGMRAACAERGFSWIFPCNANRVFAGPRGRRPRVSSRIGQLSRSCFQAIRLSAVGGKYALQRRLSCHRAKAKKKTRTYYVHAEKRAVHSVGQIQLVFSSTRQVTHKAKRESTKVLMTNMLNSTPREIVELYSVRWQIELFFKELKSILGMHQYQYQQFPAVEAWLEIILITFVYLEWTRAVKLADRRVGRRMKTVWRHQRAYGIRQAILVGIELRNRRWIAQRLKTTHGRKTLAQRLTQLLAREYRCFA